MRLIKNQTEGRLARTLVRIALTPVIGPRLIERIRISILQSKVLAFWDSPRKWDEVPRPQPSSRQAE